MPLLMYIHVEDGMAEADIIQQSPAPACCSNAHCRSTVTKLKLKIRQLQQKVYSYLMFKLCAFSALTLLVGWQEGHPA